MIRLAPLEMTDAERAVAALTPAFLDGPTMLWCFGGQSAGYEERVAGYFRVGHRWHRRGGHPVMGAFAGDALVGACYVADPGVDATPDDVRALEAELIDACGEPWAERFATYNRVVEEARPPGRLHTLAIVGVSPDHQSRGVGRALVDWACDLCDADPASEGVVLDTGSAANLRFYARFGFHPVAQVALGKGVGHVLVRPRREEAASR
jgi:GNAT superfamily N-acetyltransferase